jgi:hypothetical protein
MSQKLNLFIFLEKWHEAHGVILFRLENKRKEEKTSCEGYGVFVHLAIFRCTPCVSAIVYTCK